MIPSNALQRTFQLAFGDECGTCFTVDFDQRYYLVTARHVVEGIKNKDRLNIFHDHQWKPLDVVLVGVGEDDIDVAVFAPSHQIGPKQPFLLSDTNTTVGQDVYFLGFPYSWHRAKKERQL